MKTGKQTVASTGEGVATRHRCPALAVAYEGGDPCLLESLLATADYIEITPDAIAQTTDRGTRLNPGILAEFEDSRFGSEVLVHGVGLSIASAEGFSQDYIHLLDQAFEHFPIAWHSEHLAYTIVQGEALGTMLAPPLTREVLDLLCERVRFLQERYPAPFLLENVVRLIPDYPAEFSVAGFLNEVTHRTGCGLLLDLYNIECDAQNGRLDLEGFLDELDLSRAREIHLAGGVSLRGFQLDVHSRRTADSTIQLAARVLSRAPNVEAVTYEYLKEAIPFLGRDGICAELLRLREALNL